MVTKMVAPRPRRASLRVLSLLPSATENFYALVTYAQERRRALGATAEADTTSPAALPQLVGRSHECDYPTTTELAQLPVLTAPRTAFTSSKDVHQQVRAALAEASSLYHLDAAQLVALRPEVILTQSACRVCSIDLATVAISLEEDRVPAELEAKTTPATATVATATAMEGRGTQLVTCNPVSLREALGAQFQQLGHALGLPEEGEALAARHLAQMQALQAEAEARVQRNSLARDALANTTFTTDRPNVMLVEWLEPLFLGKTGWMREIVETAGGRVVDSLADEPDTGKPLPMPVDVVVVALCGLSQSQAQHEIAQGRVGSWWQRIVLDNVEHPPAVYIVDGTAMFTRPTPRLLQALEWLVNVLHGGDEAAAWLQTTTFPFIKYEIPTSGLSSTQAGASIAKECEDSPPMNDIEELHRLACAENRAMYTDPVTGYSVLTAKFLAERQLCCGNGCRHCPYGHVNVTDPSRRTNKLSQTVLLQPKQRASPSASRSSFVVGGQMLWPPDAQRLNTHLDTEDVASRDLCVMFWSGGKDSFLALTTLYAEYGAQSCKPMPRVVLLTSIDPVANVVPIQSTSHRQITQQAEALGLPICLVAVGLGSSYQPQVARALRDLPTMLLSQGNRNRNQNRDGKQTATSADAANGGSEESTVPSLPTITSLVFGDLHLEDIRAWREQSFGGEYNIRFPIWKKDYQLELVPLLQDTCARIGARIVYSAVEDERLKADGWKEGDVYDIARVNALNDQLAGTKTATNSEAPVDLMGERGEFHTCVCFPGMQVGEE